MSLPIKVTLLTRCGCSRFIETEWPLPERIRVPLPAPIHHFVHPKRRAASTRKQGVCVGPAQRQNHNLAKSIGAVSWSGVSGIMSARIGSMNCNCCGEPESTDGCARGFRCGCDSRADCLLCKHCTEHHHRNRSEQLRGEAEKIQVDAMIAIQKLRDKHEINIFEPTRTSIGRRHRFATGW